MTLIATEEFESPRPHRFTREEYYQMADLGWFQDRRVELIDGEITDMAPMRDLHAAATLLTQQALQRTLPDLLIRTQMPLDLAPGSAPEPDVSVVRGSARDYIGTGHPHTALLVVEVADSTLRYDREKKAGLYARAGIQDYWIINLNTRCVEVFRDPVEDPAAPFEHQYQSVQIFDAAGTLSPLAQPEAQIPVADLLP